MSSGSKTFNVIRKEFDLPTLADTDDFPEEAEAEAEDTAVLEPVGVEDATDIPFVTIDPPGAKDLDQAVYLERVGDGFRVHYAIADLGPVIKPGGAVDSEARRRVQTVYLPDARVPLHPPLLSEDALSLLPDRVRRAAIWTIDVDADGRATKTLVRRALVRSKAQLDYEGVQASFDAGRPDPSIEPLADLGRLRRKFRVSLGAIELGRHEQEILPDGDTWKIRVRARTDVDGWNAEISLLTGMSAAELMLTGGVGILRTLPDPDAAALDKFRRAAVALGIDWPDGATAGEVLSGLDPDTPATMALMRDATRLLRGAGYDVVESSKPVLSDHAGIGGPYAHVTAPLRRLADRFGTEVCLALCASTSVPEWVKEALPTLPEIMSASDRLAASIERACLDQVEAWTLDDHVGEQFEAFVLRADDDGNSAEIVLVDAPIVSTCVGAGLVDGSRISVTLRAVDVSARTVLFERNS